MQGTNWYCSRFVFDEFFFGSIIPTRQKIREKLRSKADGYDYDYTYNEKGDIIRAETTPPDKMNYDEYSYEYFDDGGYKKIWRRFVDEKTRIHRQIPMTAEQNALLFSLYISPLQKL
jgi:hypothetical protein